MDVYNKNEKQEIQHITRTVQKSDQKIVRVEEKSILLTHIFMTAHTCHSPVFVQALQ